jgi:hypothetical protein
MLLEVIAAGALVAIGLFVLIESLGRCLAAGRSVQNDGYAQTVLANKANEFRGERATDLLDQEGDCEDRPGFRWARAFEGTDTPGLWQQTLTVTWQESGKTVSDAIVEYRYLPEKQ